MKTKVIMLFAALGLCLVARADEAKPAGRIDVLYENPEKFTDLRDSYMGSDKGRDAYLEILKNEMVKQAERYVPADQKLSIMVTDVDMAGDYEPWRVQTQDVRIVKDVYPPRINLYFKLTDASGAIVKEGKRELRDLNFMSNLSTRINTNEELRYEKALVEDWVKDEFRPAKKKG